MHKVAEGTIEGPELITDEAFFDGFWPSIMVSLLTDFSPFGPQ
jgi:hypothetical protein